MLKKQAILCCFFLLSCSGPLNTDKFIVAGTYLEVVSANDKAAGIVYREFVRLDSVFDRYDSSSQVYELNHNPGQEIEVSKDLIKVIEKAKKFYRRSGGAFDISKGSLYQLWKEWQENESRAGIPPAKKIKALRDSAAIGHIRVNNENSSVLIEKKSIRLDLSAIAKGYMVDRSVAELRSRGIDSALINAGGDIYCLGKNKGDLWKVGIRGPAGGIAKIIEVSDKAVATSGNYQQYRREKGKNYSHIIDPQTGYPVNKGFLGVTVLADDCAEADALATVFFIKGEEFARQAVKDKPSLVVYFVTGDQIKKIN